MTAAIVTLKSVVSDLADIIKLQQDKEKPESIHIPSLLDELKESLREVIQNSQAEIETDFSGFEKLNYSLKTCAVFCLTWFQTPSNTPIRTERPK